MYRETIYKSLRVVAIAVACAVVVISASAQGGAAITAYSPYTMFGIGELQTIGTAQMRAMGGAGVAWRSSQMPSIANPAGYSATMQKSFLFNVGMEGNFLQNRQKQYSGDAYTGISKNGKNSVNIHEVAVQFPLAKRLGMGFSLMPYSSVGYKMSFLDQSDEIAGNVGAASYTYSGDGDVTEVKLGVGWEPFKTFSIGIAAKYYWGKITHNYVSAVDNNIVGNGSYLSVVGKNEYAISNFKFQVGMQWDAISNDKHLLTFGATYDYGGGLCPKVTKSMVLNNIYETIVSQETGVSQMQLPHSVKAGVMYQNPKIAVVAEYEFQAWGGNDGRFEESMNNNMSVKYVDTHAAKVGFSYTPNRFDVRNYLKRISYRAGFRYSNYYQQYNGCDIQQYAVTAGFGFPLKFMGNSSVDVCLEYGVRGALNSLMNSAPKIGMIRQDYFKVGVGFSLFGEDYWFVRPKYD